MSDNGGAALLVDEAPCSTVLPAGAGKTQLLARACEYAGAQGRRVLLLTHTHAGVQAMRERLHDLGVDREGINLFTLAAWADRWCTRYPGLTADAAEPSDQYQRSFRGATMAIANGNISQVVASSWDIVLVDEYQDCTEEQHAMITALRQVLPVVIVGDPLQSVFSFGETRSVVWDDTLFQNFPIAEVSSEPHRWKRTNLALGEDLLRIRSSLLRDEPIDLRSYGSIEWARADFKRRIATCKSIVQRPGRSLVIQQHRPQCVSTARRCGGVLTALEDLEARDLLKLAASIDGSEPITQVALLLDAAEKSFAKLPSGSKKRFEELRQGQPVNYKRSSKLGPVTEAALRASQATELSEILNLVRSIAALPDVVLARREFWQTLDQALVLASNSADLEVTEAVRIQRNSLRRSGRKVVDGAVATPLLVKGLEFENVLVLDADQLSTEELYVALTRASVSLVVRSSSPILSPTASRNR